MGLNYRIFKNGKYWFIIITTDFNRIIVSLVITRKNDKYIIENMKQTNTVIDDYTQRLTEVTIEKYLNEFNTTYNISNTVLIKNEDAPKFVFTKLVQLLDKLRKEWIKNEEI